MGERRNERWSLDLKAFNEKLARAKHRRAARARPVRTSSAFGQAFRIATDFIAAVAIGALIGWGLDRWLETKPWFLLLFFILGVAAGLLNVIRLANKLQAEADAKDRADQAALSGNTEPDDDRNIT